MSKILPLLGAHISIAGGFHKAIERAESIDCTTMQIFTKSNRTWFAKKISDKDAELFKDALKKSILSEIMVHSAYLINLATENNVLRNRSIKALTEELTRCQILGIKYLVLHPGSNSNTVEGIKKIADGLNEVFEECKGSSMILLETAAGQGSAIGRTFEELEDIYKLIKYKPRTGFCIDTCHIFSAGYDISTTAGYHKTLQEFDKIIGLNKLHAIHLNNSKSLLNSNIDRHEKITKGKLPLETFELIMNDPKLKNIPKVLETPILKNQLQEYEKEIILLKTLIKKKSNR